MWPATGFTKGQLLAYYAGVAPVLLPHLEDRPLTLGRFPDGVDGEGFAQTECRGRPDWLDTVAIRLRNGQMRNFCLAHDRDALLWLANLGTIELHTFLGRAVALAEPTVVLFDLDPEPPAGLANAARVALRLRERLAEQDLVSLVKTTGGTGLHVIVPLNSPHTYAQTRSFARAIAAELAAADARIVDRASRRELRAGTVLIDWAQNTERRTAIAPYSLRAAPLPLVSTPVEWAELERPSTDLFFGPDDVLARLNSLGDVFAPTLTVVQRLR
jgi:bifunctional non-homologous end joining protein LigD